jgi:hypothetical protein
MRPARERVRFTTLTPRLGQPRGLGPIGNKKKAHRFRDAPFQKRADPYPRGSFA